MGGSNTKLYDHARLDGKTAVVTGSSSGIGKVVAKELYKKGARVLMACRDLDKANAAAEEIKTECEDCKNLGALVAVHLELGSLESVRKCAAELLSSEDQIHLLINNAGMGACPKGITKDGFETLFGVNHLGHFLFTNLLLPKIKASAPARIINVTSKLHETAKMQWDDLHWEKTPYSALAAYGQSKLANMMFTIELAKKLEGTGVTTYAVHPGLIKTNIFRHLDNTYFPTALVLTKFVLSFYSKSLEDGALTTLHCALDEEAGKENGLYYSDCNVRVPSGDAIDSEQTARLWKESVKLVKLDEN